MWSAAFYFGNFVGPTMSGFWIDAYGFEWTTMILLGVYIFVMIVDFSEFFYNCGLPTIYHSYKPTTIDNQNTENMPLIENTNN